MNYFICNEINDARKIEELTCPSCGNELLFQGYNDGTLGDYYDLKNAYVYKCSDYKCGNVFLSADIKPKFGIIK